MWVFGGYDNATGACNDLFAYDISSNTWHKIEQENKPPTRFCHSAYLIKEKESMIKLINNTLMIVKQTKKLW